VQPPTDDIVELCALAFAYAHGADRNDPQTFLSAFHPDGRLLIFADSADPSPRAVRTGADELAAVPGMLTRYERTFHFVGNHRYELEGDGARGEIYCLAHHLSTNGERHTDSVMHIRYLDRYRRDPDGAWRIAEREVRPDWTELRTW